MEILLTVALMYGLTFALKDAKLLNRPRGWLVGRSDFFGELLSCAYCTGFHSGWVSFLLLRSSDITSLPWIQGLVIYAFAGAAVSYVVDVVLLHLESDD